MIVKALILQAPLSKRSTFTFLRSCSLCWSLQTESVATCTEIKQRIGFQSAAFAQSQNYLEKNTWIVLDLKKLCEKTGNILVLVGWQEEKKAVLPTYSRCHN